MMYRRVQLCHGSGYVMTQQRNTVWCDTTTNLYVRIVMERERK